MTKTNGKALEVAHTYVKAIANKDVETILSISTEDVACTSPIGQTIGIERFRAFHDGFALAGHDPRSQVVIRTKHPVVARQVDPGAGYQNGQPGQKIQRLEDHVRRTVPVRRLQCVANVALRREREPLDRHRRAGNVAA